MDKPRDLAISLLMSFPEIKDRRLQQELIFAIAQLIERDRRAACSLFQQALGGYLAEEGRALDEVRAQIEEEMYRQ